MADKGWPVHTVTIQGFGWTITFWDPTVADLETFNAAIDAKDKTASRQLVASMIKDWDCVDRLGNPLPKTAESLSKLPGAVMAALTDGLMGTNSPKAEGGAGDSKPTSPPDTEGTA